MEKHRLLNSGFILVFCGIGIAFLFVFLSTLVSRWQMQFWVQVPAQILSTKLETSVDEDGTSYKVFANYSYAFGGQSYEGNRVSLHHWGYDNLGDFHERKHKELKAFYDKNLATVCWVNSNRPEQSVLYRELRLGRLLFYAVFAAGFGGFGLAAWRWPKKFTRSSD